MKEESLTLANDMLLPEVGRLVAEGNEVVLRAKGNSMLPFIRNERDSIVMSAPKEPFVGEIVLAEVAPGRFVMHRIVSIDGDRITMMGDGNIRGTESFDRKHILAHVSKIIRCRKDGGESSRIDCESPRHLRLARLWGRLLPLRRWLLALRRIISFAWQ